MILVDNADFRNPRLTFLCFDLGIWKHSLFLDCYYLLLLLPRSIFIGIRRKLFWRTLRTVSSLKTLSCSQAAFEDGHLSIYMLLLALFSLTGAFEDSSWLFRGEFVTSVEYECLRMNFWKVWVKELAWLFSTSCCDTHVPCIDVTGGSFLIQNVSLSLVKMEVWLIMLTFLPLFHIFLGTFSNVLSGKSALFMHSIAY